MCEDVGDHYSSHCVCRWGTLVYRLKNAWVFQRRANIRIGEGEEKRKEIKAGRRRRLKELSLAFETPVSVRFKAR